jgi:iron complex outermembrane receptor protein
MYCELAPRRVDTAERNNPSCPGSARIGPRTVWLAIAAVVTLASAVPAAADDDKPTSLTTEPVTVEAVRPGEVPEDPSSFTTLIEMDAFYGESKEIEEILGQTVGVQIRRFGGAGDRSEISIRGSSASQVVVLLDGVRLNSPQTGGVDLSTIPVELIERIEVSRGGGSVQNGSDAIGGVVNIITRRAGGVPRTTLAFSGESFGTWRGAATQTGSIREHEFALGYSGFATDGDWTFKAVDTVRDGVLEPGPDGDFERVNHESETHAAQLKWGHDLGDWGRISFSDNFSHDSAGRPGPDFGVGELRGQSLTAHQRRTRNLASLLLEAEDLGSAEIDAELHAFHRYARSRFFEPAAGIGRSAIDSDNRNHSIGGRLSLAGGGQLGCTEHRLAWDGELRYDLLFAKNALDRDRRTLGASLQDEIRLFDGGIRLIPALRVDHTQGFGVEWIPRLGVIVRAFPWLEFKGNVERSYRVANFDELYFNEGEIRGNPNLNPEDAFNADAGFEFSWQQLGPLSDLWLEFAAFRNDIDESIVFIVQPLGVSIASNTGSARAEGIELGGGLRVFDWLGLSANWTHLDAKLKGSDLPLPGRAEDEVFARAEFGPPSRVVKWVGEVSHRSSIPVSSSGFTRLESGTQTVYGLSLVVDFLQIPGVDRVIPGRHLRFSVSVDNLTDASLRDAQFFPQPGRTFAFRVEWEG